MSNLRKLTAIRKFHTENPGIYNFFEKEARKVAAQRDHYSHITIFHFMRHHTLISGKGDAEHFKINNNYMAYYARLFNYRNPHLKKFFQLRFSEIIDGHIFSGSHDYLGDLDNVPLYNSDADATKR